MHLFPYSNNFRSRIKKRLLIPDQNWDKNIYNFRSRIKKRLLIPDQKRNKNSLIIRSRVKEKVTFPHPHTEKDIKKKFRNELSDRDINQHLARFSNLINQK